MTGDTGWDDHRYRVLGNRPVTPVIRELDLTPDDDALDFSAGQYVLLADGEYRVPPRSYSVANAPRPDGRISLLVTRVPDGPTSCWVHDELAAGDTVVLTGPFGTFVPDAGRDGPVLLLAAGSGLAPARALAEAFRAGAPRRPVTLFFSARTSADTIDDDRFRTWAGEDDAFRYLLALTREPDARALPHVPERLPAEFGTLAGWEVFAAGPPGFVTSCAAVAQRLGADPDAVHTEEFFADPQPWSGSPPASAREQRASEHRGAQAPRSGTSMR